MSQLTWLITGCSSGFGEELILSILSRGDRAIATTRGSTDRIKHLRDAGAATMSLDVTSSQAELDAKVQEALNIYDGIDVLINNAGYIEAGLIEDITSVISYPKILQLLTDSFPSSHERLLASCNTNLFGPVNLTRSTLPHFRQRKAGTIIFMGSVGGWQGEIGAAPYCVGKFGMEGMQLDNFALDRLH
jgi:NAD(P)-dependent dehydrogenase (short-subunit alcohol dehydrogenase family)